jgi:hypothetical protein
VHQGFHRSGLIPGASSKRSSDPTTFVETRTLQDPRLSAPALAREIMREFDLQVSWIAVN